MTPDALEDNDNAKWDPDFTETAMAKVRPFMKRWYRSEVRGLEHIPPGGSLVVSNHSGGVLAVDAPVFAVDFYEHYGYDRPIYTLATDMLFTGPMADPMTRMGFLPASRENAAKALRSGGIVLLFPGGTYDSFRPTLSANKIDFAGRTGYVTSALEAGTPIVPMVSIGGQENQLYLLRGDKLARWLGIKRLLRTEVPVTLGLPSGLNVLLPLNLPLPTKIVTQVLPPIDIAAQFGADPDIVEVDEHIRSTMQTALNELARNRRFPVFG